MQPAGHFSFGAGGTVTPCLGEGWCHPEPDFTWTTGTSSRLRLPLVPGAGQLMLELVLHPMRHPPCLTRQRIILHVNDIPLAEASIHAECALSLPIPDRALSGKNRLDIVLTCPDAASPAALGAGPDPRMLGVAVREILLLWAPARPDPTPVTLPPLPPTEGGLPEAVRAATGLTMPALAARFESLGLDCEFGLAQRQMGADQIGLLRFAGLSIDRLLIGLDQGFEGLGTPEDLRVFTRDDGPAAEFIVQDARYNMVLHTHQTVATTTAAALLPAMARHLAFLRRKLLEDLASGHKIFVFNHAGTRTHAQARPILHVLRSHGPNALLFVSNDHAEQAGTVRRLDDDLLQGWVDDLGADRARKRLDLAAWTSLCANAHRLRHAGAYP
jgi:hypothetical protein